MTDAEERLRDLNPEQRAAVVAVERPVLVLAGAGSGKTRVIVHKIAYLVRELGLPSHQILALTFTNRAAGEMRQRTIAMLGEEAERATIGTFHSIGLRILREHASLVERRSGFVVYDAQDQEALVKRVLRDLNFDPKLTRPKDVLHRIEAHKRRCDPASVLQEAAPGTFEAVVWRVFEQYEKRLRKANAVDFGDLLRKVVDLFERHPEVRDAYQYRWRYVLVDEFQDTNHAQVKIVRQLVERRDGSLAGLTVVGDDDQSIYGWRGAHVENILSFPDAFDEVETVRLERNYRSSGNILAAAGSVIEVNERRHEKRLWTERDAGEPLEIYAAPTELDEARWAVSQVQHLRQETPLREMAIFYRTHAQSRAFEEVLARAGIPYRLVGGLRFYERAEVKDVIAYLRLLVNPDDDVSLTRIINRPRRGIGDATVRKLLERARVEGTSAWRALPACAETIGRGSGKRLREFQAMMDGLRVSLQAVDRAGARPMAAVLRVLERSGYAKQFEGDPSVEAETRRANVMEVVSAAEAMEASQPDATLATFLDDAALVSDLDRVDADTDALTLMTIHGAKGLEFDVVFVGGLEDGLFPHANSVHDDASFEEERRLFYVALTRARHRLFLSFARTRRRYGALESSSPSVFLDHLPPEILRQSEGERLPVGVRSPSVRRRRSSERPSVPAGHQEEAEEVVVPDELAAVGMSLTLEDVMGRRVRHPSFGVGRIVGGRDGRLRVDFEFAGTKAILPQFVKLLD